MSKVEEWSEGGYDYKRIDGKVYRATQWGSAAQVAQEAGISTEQFYDMIGRELDLRDANVAKGKKKKGGCK